MNETRPTLTGRPGGRADGTTESLGGHPGSIEANLCAADAHTHVVKTIFFKGASLPDPDGFFNAELGGNARRAIEFVEGDRIEHRALKKLVRAAGVRNGTESIGRTPRDRPPSGGKSRRQRGLGARV